MHPCRYPCCAQLLAKPGYCSTHAKYAPNKHKLYDITRRQDPALRKAAMFRSSSRWQKARRFKIATSPMCEDPFGYHTHRGLTGNADQVHHIKPLVTHPELCDDQANLMSVCTKCHARLESEA